MLCLYCLRTFSVAMWVDKLVLVLAEVVVGGALGQLAPVKPAGSLRAGSWWTNAVYYRILIDSFRDSNGDGLGDLKGATQQLSYVRALGADAVILSSAAARSSSCSHPGIADHVELDSRYGSIEDLMAFLEKARGLDLKAVITLELQTMSSVSPWFQSSVERASGFEDLFVWRGEKPAAIYDWVWNDNRKSFYATFDDEAVLNLCSESTVAALSAAQCAWLRRGFSGVLLNPDFPLDQSCGEKLLKQLAADAKSCMRSALSEYPVILAESSLPWQETGIYYSDSGAGAHSVLSAALTASERRTTPELALAIHAALLLPPTSAWPTWMTSTGKQRRVASRYGSDMIDAINLIAMVLPGAVIINQGDELGLFDSILAWSVSNTTCWPTQRQPWFSPMPWDDTINGAFSSGEPWIPMSPNSRYANAKTEFKNDFSHVGVVRVGVALRNSPNVGTQVEVKRIGPVLAILRWGGSGSLLLISNIGIQETFCSLSSLVGLPPEMTVATSSGGSSFAPGVLVPTEKALKLMPGETVLLAGPPRHCGGPGPVDRITNKLTEGWQKINKYFTNI